MRVTPTVRKRLWIGLGGATVAVSIFLVIFVVLTLRDPPLDACATMLGRAEDLAELAKQPLDHDGIGGDRDCRVRYWPRGKTATEAIVTITNRDASHFEERVIAQGVAERAPLVTGRGDGVLLTTATHVAALWRHGATMTELVLLRSAFDPATLRRLLDSVGARLSP